MLRMETGEAVGKVGWLSTWLSTNGSHKGPTGAHRTICNMASELRKHHYSILRRNIGKNF
jgi:hypothetical protein